MATPTPPTAPPPAPARSGGGGNKILIGCGVGCGILLLLALVAGGIAYVKLVKPMVDKGKAMEEASKANEEALAELRRIDESVQSSIGEDLASAQLAASDVDTYIELRGALADEAEAAAAARNRMAEALGGEGLSGGNPMAMIGMMMDFIGSATDYQIARGALLQAAVPELEAAGVSPTEFARLVEMIEWRFLQRPEALTTALTADERNDWTRSQIGMAFAQTILRASEGQGNTAQFERNLEQAQERLDELEAAAAERTGLSAETRNVLEARRAELQALPGSGLGDLASLTDSQDPGQWMEGLR